MPIYEYKCPSCNQRFEVIQRLSDPPVSTCESCGGTVEKQVSAPAIQFKGSGWYVTDYARKGGEGKSESEGGEGKSQGEGKGGDGKSEGKGDAKSESKSETKQGDAGGGETKKSSDSA